jgi:predicted nucleotidyltransferase component of viral defense system
MAAKRTLTVSEQSRLRHLLQVATVAALMDSRRWEPGELAFQGGTSLHLVHGSARFSEDLDFMMRGGLSLRNLAVQVRAKLRIPGLPSDLQISVTPLKDDRNPHRFEVVLNGANVLGSVRVKVELWETPSSALKSLHIVVRPVKSELGQVFVPVLTLEEIHADKVFALAARDRIKPRDIYDLWWLSHQGLKALDASSLRSRLEIYPANTPLLTVQSWLEKAASKVMQLSQPQLFRSVSDDLKKWVPSSLDTNPVVVGEMLAHCALELKSGMAIMQDYADALLSQSPRDLTAQDFFVDDSIPKLSAYRPPDQRG